MVLAAGLGTRLRPLTNDRPKALVEINGRTLLEITIMRLAAFGVRELIVNVHHFADMVVQYLKSKNNFGVRVEISREDDVLLDTGGGLKKAAWFFGEDSTASKLSNAPDEPFFLHNVDVISDIDLREMLRFHKGQNALATLAVQSRESSRQLLFDNKLHLAGRRIEGKDIVISNDAKNLSSSSPLAPRRSAPLTPLAFSGIHVISSRIFPLLTETGVFSIIDSYLRLASQGEKIVAFRHDGIYWRDLGRPADLAQAAADLRHHAALS